MRVARGFRRFWYYFLVGYVWKIAAAVGVVLAVGAGIVLAGSYDDHVLTALLALGVAAAFTTALLIDVRRAGR